MILPLTKNVYLGATLAGRTTNETFEQWEMDAPTRPRFGRNWWYWMPSLRTNGGRLRSHECTDINFHWLCLGAWITVFPWSRTSTGTSRGNRKRTPMGNNRQ